MTVLVVTGTDTGIGKTVFSAGLAGALGAHYWKPIQAGVDPEGDKESVAALSGLPASHILPEAYRLATPASPHLAARIDGVEISLDCLALPQVDGPLVVEGAGGVMCDWNGDPLTSKSEGHVLALGDPARLEDVLEAIHGAGDGHHHDHG